MVSASDFTALMRPRVARLVNRKMESDTGVDSVAIGLTGLRPARPAWRPNLGE